MKQLKDQSGCSGKTGCEIWQLLFIQLEEKKMGKMALDDFIKYVKEQFDCEISVKKCDKLDTFASIFGAGFLNDKDCVEMTPIVYHL